MSINENIKQEEFNLITEAISSTDPQRLQKLSKSVYSNVRKAVAKNNHVSSSVINHMIQFERSSSVLYWLNQNPACYEKKLLSQEDLNNKCVTCDVSEMNLYNTCQSCTKS